MYYLHPLPGIRLAHKHQLCCVRECGELQSSLRLAGSEECCCLGCNRHRCPLLSEESAEELAEGSHVVVPSKDDADPEIVSLVV